MLGWLDLSSGASGDMLLGAFVGAGASLTVVKEAVSALGLPIDVVADTVERHGLVATRVRISTDEVDPPQRRWSDIRALLTEASLDERVRSLALQAFALLADAEAAVHGGLAADVHFHEVGAHDAVGDIVGVCAAAHDLDLGALTATPVALGGGSVRSAHGLLPVPVPAVLGVLARSSVPSHGGPVEVELCTPTGAALVATLVAGFGPMPAMTVSAVGAGAGSRELADRANVVRLVVGS